jgi:hypothetical protein
MGLVNVIGRFGQPGEGSADQDEGWSIVARGAFTRMGEKVTNELESIDFVENESENLNNITFSQAGAHSSLIRCQPPL